MVATILIATTDVYTERDMAAGARRKGVVDRNEIAGDQGESFFVILDGQALVTAGAFTDVVIGPGDFFG